MNILVLTLLMPVAASLLCFIFRRIAGWIALLISAMVLVLAGKIFFGGEILSVFLGLRAYVLSSGIFLTASFFTLLITLYSLKFMEGKERLGEYYGYIMITLAAAAGVAFAGDFLILLFFWGILGITLYMLIGLGGPEATSAAKKTFIIIGGTDALMILGIGIIWALTRNVQLLPYHIPLNNSLTVIAFLSLAAGAFAKAGAIPLHSWIPDCAEVAPTTVMAYLPAALDKLLGIYLLTRICVDIFQVVPNSAVSILLLIIGSVTIVAAVMGALVQHNLKKLLAFHAVSQVGYMILGIGTGIPVAIAGGLFHMLNNAVYKSLLFLAGGAVEKQTGTTELDQLGGLAKFMPITFFTALIAALSISGVPPLNGFVSKWMIYQGVIELGKTSPYWIIWLVAAMFGSALTLASFMKIIYAVFLGQASKVSRCFDMESGQSPKSEVNWMMWLPMIILAALCVIFGVFANALPLAYFILPSIQGVVYTGFFNPTLAALLLVVGLLAGLLVYWMGRVRVATSKPAYIGGELLEVKVTGVDFYNTVKEWGPLEGIYGKAEKKTFDVYEIGSKITFGLSDALKWLHSGQLHTYLAWMFLGGIILLYVLMR